MFTKRIIPCLDVNNGRVVKGVNFVQLRDAGDPVEIAKAYEEAGAACISVLTEPKWFLGKDEYLKEIAQTVQIPCIRKDFVVDEYMIYEAKTNLGLITEEKSEYEMVNILSTYFGGDSDE